MYYAIGDERRAKAQNDACMTFHEKDNEEDDTAAVATGQSGV
jgi:hypothetical protein